VQQLGISAIETTTKTTKEAGQNSLKLRKTNHHIELTRLLSIIRDHQVLQAESFD